MPVVLKLQSWMPDRVPMDNPGVLEANDVYPAATGFQPVKTYSARTSALDARARGAILARDDDDVVFQFAGDAAKLYQNVAETWTNRSKSGGYTVGVNDRWDFVRWDAQVFATNYTDNIQKITLGGSVFSDLTTALRAKSLAVVKRFVVAGWTEDLSDGDIPWRVRWCAFNDPTDWTVSSTTLADYQDLTPKKIQKVFGGEYGVIMQDTSVWRMTFVGSPTVFQFDEVLPNLGLIAPGAACRSGETIYFLSEKGFYSLDQGTRATPIGSTIVDQFIRSDLDYENVKNISSVSAPNSQRVFWLYPGSGSSGGLPNRIICYDPSLGPERGWSLINQEAWLLWQGAASSVTLEGLDSLYATLEDVPASLDSLRWVGGNEELALFDSTHKSGFLDGTARTATMTTSEIQLRQGYRGRLGGFRPLIEGGGATIRARVGYRNDVNEDVTWTDYLSPNTGGRIPCRINARYMRFEIEVSGDAWSRAYAVYIDDKDIGVGGRRG